MTINRQWCYVEQEYLRTALMMAAEGGHHECVSILVANGADVNAYCRVSAYMVHSVE